MNNSVFDDNRPNKSKLSKNENKTCNNLNINNTYIIENGPSERFAEVCKTMVEIDKWDMSFSDYEQWLKAFADGDFTMYFCVDGETNKTICSISMARYRSPKDGNESMVFSGCYYTMPEYRGMGFGLRLCKMVCTSPNLCAYGVESMYERYKVEHCLTERSEWKMNVIAAPGSVIDAQNLYRNDDNTNYSVTMLMDGTKKNEEYSVNVLPWTDVEFDKICEFDATLTSGKIDRSRYLFTIFDREQSYTMVARMSLIHNKNMMVEEKETSYETKKAGHYYVCGLCHIRVVAGNRLTIGPFYANNLEIARRFLRATFEPFRDGLNSSVYTQLIVRLVSTNTNARSLIDSIVSKDRILISNNSDPNNHLSNIDNISGRKRQNEIELENKTKNNCVWEPLLSSVHLYRSSTIPVK